MKILNEGDSYWFLGHEFSQGENKMCFMNEGTISSVGDGYVTMKTKDNHKFMVMNEDLYDTVGECFAGMEKLAKRERN